MANPEEKTETTGKDVHPSRPVALKAPLATFSDMERWFDEFVGRGWMQPFQRWPDVEALLGKRLPKIDVIDRDQEIVVRAELPGVGKDDLDVSLDEQSVTVSATTRQEKKEDERNYHLHEISQGSFRRTVPLPCAVNGDQAKASFKDGVLELTIPKVTGAQRKTVKIE
jgi:HSP20 family protein